jgi:hypothetical protein
VRVSHVWGPDVGRNIGALGHARAPIDLEFTYFGVTVRVHPQATDAVEVEFLQASQEIDMDELAAIDFDKIESMEEEARMALIRKLGRVQQAGYKALMSSLRRLIHPDDFDAYWKVGMENGQQVRDRMADIRAITSAVAEAVTDFPTGQRSGSPVTPEPTRASSEAGSSSHPSELTTALALERGRPDLQEFYVMVAEQQAAMDQEAKDREAKDREKLRAAGVV